MDFLLGQNIRAWDSWKFFRVRPRLQRFWRFTWHLLALWHQERQEWAKEARNDILFLFHLPVSVASKVKVPLGRYPLSDFCREESDSWGSDGVFLDCFYFFWCFWGQKLQLDDSTVPWLPSILFFHWRNLILFWSLYGVKEGFFLLLCRQLGDWGNIARLWIAFCRKYTWLWILRNSI